MSRQRSEQKGPHSAANQRPRSRHCGQRTTRLAVTRPLSPTVPNAQVTAPVPAAESPAPQYPDAALFAGIEGDVRYRAHVAADGRVTNVDVLSVPAQGYGFEDVVRRTVSGWHFTPASRDGVAIDATYEGKAVFIPALPGEFSFAVPSEDAWAAIEAMVKDLHAGTQQETPLDSVAAVLAHG